MLHGSAQPLGLSKTVSYDMESHQYTGRVFYATFRTEVALDAWLPAPLQAVDPHEGFIKAYSLKRRPEGGEYAPPRFSQYREVCTTILATAPGIDETPRHYNLFMWVTHDWALFRAREVHGWPKKLADITITNTYPFEAGYDRDVDSNTFQVDVSRYGYNILTINATLDGLDRAYQMPPFGGFYSYRRIAAPNGSQAIEELLVIETRDAWLGEPTYGSAIVDFGKAPDEELELMGKVVVSGCLVRDIGWILPAYPARRMADFSIPEPSKSTSNG